MMEAERVSRTSDPAERATALAEAARCLVLLERNLEQAQAFVYEVQSLAQHADGVPMHAVAFTEGALRAHRSELDEAVDALAEARSLARQSGERLAEFQALEHTVMLEIDRSRIPEACRLVDELRDLGARVRDGSETAGSTALRALCTWLRQPDPDAERTLQDAIEALASVDAKQRLCFVCGRWARALVEQGQLELARAQAQRVLDAAGALERTSEIARGHLVLLRIATKSGALEEVRDHVEALQSLDRRILPTPLVSEVSSALAETFPEET